MRFVPFAVVHLVLAALWFGSMSYSLAVVQPKVAAFFADEERREEFLVTLAQGNRWRVVGLIGALVVTGLGAIATGGTTIMRAAFAIAVALELVAGALFWHVSWRHWPARVFALPAELPGYQRRLRVLATAMTGLIGAAFLLTLVASTRNG